MEPYQSLQRNHIRGLDCDGYVLGCY